MNGPLQPPKPRGRPKASTKDAVQELIEQTPSGKSSLGAEEAFLDKELEREIRVEDLVEKRKKNEILQENKELRKCYALRIFILTCIWAILIFIIVFSLGTSKFVVFTNIDFKLSDKVTIALITSTTINFFGFFLLVIRYLFHTDGSSSSSSNKKKTTSKKKRTK